MMDIYSRRNRYTHSQKWNFKDQSINSKNYFKRKLGRSLFLSISCPAIVTDKQNDTILISSLLSDPVGRGWQYWCLRLWLWLRMLASFWRSWRLARLTTRRKWFRNFLTFAPILENFSCNSDLLRKKCNPAPGKWKMKRRKIWNFFHDFSPQ